MTPKQRIIGVRPLATKTARTQRRLELLAMALFVSTGAAGQVYKCPDAAGRTVIQQMPCAGGGQKLDVRPASGHAPPPSIPASGAAKPMTEAERLNAWSEASARDRRKQDLDERLTPRARAAMFGHRADCQQEVARLRQGQYAYKQNLYGKTHAAQVASEIAAINAQCDTKDRELTREYDTLKAECQSLGGCKAMVP